MASLRGVLALPTPALRTLLEPNGLDATADVAGPAEWLVDPHECSLGLTYDASMVAVAARDTLVLCRRETTEDGAGERWRTSNPIVPASALQLATEVTALAWLRPHNDALGGPFLAVGTSTGHLLLYARDGAVVLKQLIHNSPILQIKCRPVAQHSGSDGSSDIALLLHGLVVHIEGADICELLARERSDYGAIDEEQGPTYLPHRKWKLHDQALTADVVCCGRMPPGLSEIVPHEAPPYQILAAGKGPCLAVYAAHGQPSIFPGFGTLASKGVAAVAGVMKWAWGASEPEAAADEPKPPPLERTVGVRPMDGGVLSDPTRRLERLELDPSGRLVAGTDGFGRVMLIDVAGHLPVVTRLWKGYREAQVVWVHGEELQPGAQGPAALLAIYLPRRGLLEVWPASAGARVAAMSVGRELRLVAASSGRLGVQRGGESALPRQASSGLRPWFACQCFLLAADGTLSNLVVESAGDATAQIPVPGGLDASTVSPLHSVADQAKEQVIYRDFLHHVASGDGEDVLLKAIASINGTQALLSALKAIAESQPSHARLNWKAASVAVVELEFSHKRSPSPAGSQLLDALKRREDLLRAYCVLSGEASVDESAVASPRGRGDISLWSCGDLHSQRLWLLKYSAVGAADAEALAHVPTANCILFLQCFPPVQDVAGGGIVDSVDAVRLVARTLFQPLVQGAQGDESADHDAALQRVASAIVLLGLSNEELWRVFAEWFMQQPLVGKAGKEAGTLLGKVDAGGVEPKVLRYMRSVSADGSARAMQLCQHCPRIGHVLAFTEICAAVEAPAASDNWSNGLDVTRRAWELHKLLTLVARHANLPIGGYGTTTSLTRLATTLQLRLGDGASAGSKMDVDDSYLRRIEPGSPLARRAAFAAVCQAFPRHTVPGMLDIHAAVVIASQWNGSWMEHVPLESVCALLETLGQRTAASGGAPQPSQLANARAVGAMLIWQRFCREGLDRLLGGLETGHGWVREGESHTAEGVAHTLGLFGRIVRLFDPAQLLERKFSLGTETQNIMDKLDDALSEELSDAPPIDLDGALLSGGSNADSDSASQASKTKQQAFEVFGLGDAGVAAVEWPPIELADEYMGVADFGTGAAVRVSACDKRTHLEFSSLLQVLAAMAKHNITDFNPSALFRCHYCEDDSGSPLAPLDAVSPDEPGDSPRSSSQRHARDHLIQKLIGCNDLIRALLVAGLFGHDCEKVRLQWVLRAYEMGNEGGLEQEVVDAIDGQGRYKLGVGLLTVGRQRLCRVLEAAQARVEEQAARERMAADGGNGAGHPAIVTKHEKMENELLRLMQLKVAQKQVRTCNAFCIPLLCCV